MARGHSPTLRDAWTVSYICSTLDGWARPVLNLDQRIDAYMVESENFESIHNHSAYALIKRDKKAS